MFGVKMGITMFSGLGSGNWEFTYLSTFQYFKDKLVVFYREEI